MTSYRKINFQTEGQSMSQKELKLVQRQTGIWEERNGNWVMIHEHLSAPSSLQDNQ